MKKLLVFLLMLFASVSYSNAQSKGTPVKILGTVICVPDCPLDSFESNPMETISFTLNGCPYEVDFYWRKACNRWCDLLIWRVRSINGPPCSDVDQTLLLNAATAQAIIYAKNNIPGMDCGPQNIGDCSSYWRVSKSACWKKFQNSGYVITHPPSSSNYFGGISYCDSDVCCLTYYEVCIDQFGQVVVTAVQQTSTAPCPYDPTGTCKPVCGE